MIQQPYVPFNGGQLLAPPPPTFGTLPVIAFTDPVGSGSFAGQYWLNRNTNNKWFWTGSAWQSMIVSGSNF